MAETVVDQATNSSTVIVENEVCFFVWEIFYSYFYGNFCIYTILFKIILYKQFCLKIQFFVKIIILSNITILSNN